MKAGFNHFLGGYENNPSVGIVTKHYEYTK